MTTILRGKLLRWAGDPFEIGDAALAWDEDGAVAFADGRIASAGPADAVLAAHLGATVHTQPDALIAPAFVDCHLHYPQTHVIASWGAQLIDWLNRFTFPEESRFADPEHAAAVARAFFAETLRNGVGTVCSFCTSHPQSVDAFMAEAERRGLRAVAGKVLMDRHAPPALLDDATRAFDETEALIARWRGRGRLQVAITPRFAPTSTPEQLDAAGALAAAHPDCPVQTHLSENTAEIAWVADLFPEARDYLDVYDRHGLLRPQTVFGHAIHLTARERARLAEAGAAVAHCPTSNAFLGSGACDVAGLKADGVRVGLASDVGGGTSFSPFATMRAAYEIGQSRGRALTPVELWWLAGPGAAGALGLGDRVGNLAQGFDADAVVIDLAATPLLAARTARAENPAEALFALAVLGDDRAVRETWSGGRRVHRRADARDG
ncbi:MAG: guanine deaminase [Rhodobacteraceae bacterium]|nr:MAG: guanine deaminase [Paracoccaceae bacterium]